MSSNLYIFTTFKARNKPTYARSVFTVQRRVHPNHQPLGRSQIFFDIVFLKISIYLIKSDIVGITNFSFLS